MALQRSFSMGTISRVIVMLPIFHNAKNIGEQFDVLPKNLGDQFVGLFDGQCRQFF
jgi:hypothetical protein